MRSRRLLAADTPLSPAGRQARGAARADAGGDGGAHAAVDAERAGAPQSPRALFVPPSAIICGVLYFLSDSPSLAERWRAGDDMGADESVAPPRRLGQARAAAAGGARRWTSGARGRPKRWDQPGPVPRFLRAAPLSIETAGEQPAALARPDTTVPLHERKLYRVGPNCETWPNTLTENPY